MAKQIELFRKKKSKIIERLKVLVRSIARLERSGTISSEEAEKLLKAEMTRIFTRDV